MQPAGRKFDMLGLEEFMCGLLYDLPHMRDHTELTVPLAMELNQYTICDVSAQESP